MQIDRAIELLQQARRRYGGGKDMIITVQLLDDIVRALDRMDRDVWREPRVRQVTPEAMAELEARNATDVLIMSRDWLYQCSYTSDRGWIRHDDYANALISRPARGWFILRGELPEVT